jgi:hypothetical protein
VLILVLQTVEEIFFGNGKLQIIAHATKEPITVRFGLTSITPEMIAYGACQVCVLLLIWLCFGVDHAFVGSILSQFHIGMAHARHDVQLGRLLLQCPLPF